MGTTHDPSQHDICQASSNFVRLSDIGRKMTTSELQVSEVSEVSAIFTDCLARL